MISLLFSNKEDGRKYLKRKILRPKIRKIFYTQKVINLSKGAKIEKWFAEWLVISTTK